MVDRHTKARTRLETLLYDGRRGTLGECKTPRKSDPGLRRDLATGRLAERIRRTRLGCKPPNRPNSGTLGA
jgi:hypothetical protein